MDGEIVLELRAARFSERFVAYLIDTLPFGAGAVLTAYVWGGPLGKPLEPESLSRIAAAWITLAVLYQFAANVSGAGLGKALMGLRVLTLGGEVPGAFRSLARALFWLLGTPLCNFGFLLALLRADSRALHDLLSGTVVVEAAPQGRGEGLALFLAGGLCAGALLGANLWLSIARPTPGDLQAVARAREGLEVLGRVQEARRRAHGAYTDRFEELAESSGEPEAFGPALDALFEPGSLAVEAGNVGYRFTARAKDRRRTRVSLSGPSRAP